MSSSNDQLAKKARLQRHVKRDNVLKARFSPTAIWTTTPTAVKTPLQTSTNGAPTSAPPAAATSTTRPHTPVTPSAANTSTTPATTSTTTSTTATPAINTTTSSTITSTTSSTTTSTTTSTTPVTTTPLSTPSTSNPPTAYVTTTLGGTAAAAVSGSLTGTAASQTASTTTSGVSTAGIIGIAAASIVGVAVLAGIIVFFFRRWSRRDGEFSQADFRRQSVALRDDEPSSLYRGNSGGRGPRPPTMIERRNMAGFTSQPMSAPQPSYPFGSPSPFNDFASPQPSPSFGPGQIIPSFPPAHMEGQAQYANAAPFFNPSFQSPMGSPVTVASYGGAAFDAQGRLVRMPSNAATPTLSRGNSMAHPHHPGSPPLPEDAEYADLSRASVTPFQAAQYAAISKQLNIPPPMPLHQVTEGDEHEEYGQNLPVYEDNSGSPMDLSPFDDPRSDVKHSFRDNAGDDLKPSRPSSEFHSVNPIALTREPSTRITSIPPTLPELQMIQRAFSPVDYNFPATPSPRSATFDAPSMRNPAGAMQEPSPLGRASPKIDLPPLSPVPHSPQRAQFVSGVESHAHNGRETPVEIGFVAESGVVAPASKHAEPPRTQVSEKRRPETLYDDEDAYGGF
ncbi:hypothetical protein M0805_003982 [Coniferiporia weirii]|nr:hypothetical protein M0805_003982 [Coniferiporia weirii]